MPTYLDEIILHHREASKADSRKTEELFEKATDTGPCLGFRDALCGPGVSVIAEIKRKSPSKGDLNSALDPVSLAKKYEQSGASCISVLTDHKYFLGSLGDLRSVRAAVEVPLLRKDFTVAANDVLDAKINGADAILLIVAALSYGELTEFYGLAKEVGLDVLVEVHDQEELVTAYSIGSDLIGVNQRDLTTFVVDEARAISMAPLLNSSVVKVCESGIYSSAQVKALAEVGYDAVLVGETLVRADDPRKVLAELLFAGRSVK